MRLPYDENDRDCFGSPVIGGGRPSPTRPVCPRVQEASQLFDASEPRAAAEARDFVASLLQQWGAGDLTDDVLLVCSELLANVLRHVGSPWCVLRVEVGEVVRLTVHDTSRVLPSVQVGEELAESGRGLFLVSAIASRWGCEPTLTGKSVWAEFNRAPARPTMQVEEPVRWSA